MTCGHLHLHTGSAQGSQAGPLYILAKGGARLHSNMVSKNAAPFTPLPAEKFPEFNGYAVFMQLFCNGNVGVPCTMSCYIISDSALAGSRTAEFSFSLPCLQGLLEYGTFPK